MKEQYQLYLDDIRHIPDGFVGVRNYNSFVQMITENGLPTFISFDHDLGEEKSGYDCAKWLVYYCFKNNLLRPEYSIHSMNPVGRDNVDFIMKNKVKPFKLQKIITLNQMSENDGLKSIQQIIKLVKEFRVEDYQRGYRWTATEVTQLLEDINEFEGKEYCLQPVVVKQLDDKKEKIELIDGQQRMTTIYLILKCLDVKHVNPFSISYATRDKSEEFLNDIDNDNVNNSNSNIDFFHFYQAYQTIKEWFVNNKPVDFKDKLLNQCKVIWYEVPAGTDKAESIKIFTRINSGKIPLTNAELIKALFLINVSDKKGDGDELLQLKQNEIAQQWDQIEYALQDDRFWFFISNDTPPATRIELIFDLVQEKAKNQKDKLFTFLKYNESFKGETDKAKWVEAEWKDVHDKFQTLQEWYEDRELYHLVGYLINSESFSIADLISLTKENTKSKFKNILKSITLNSIISSIKESDNKTLNWNKLNELSYGDYLVKKVLLLHNILTLQANPNESYRFPFDLYHKEKWNIEHIHAIASEVNVPQDKRRDWIENNRATAFNTISEQIKNNAEKIIEDNATDISDEDFKIYILPYILGEEVNTIENLCLLDEETNKSYKNNGFAFKRKKIISQESKEQKFIPYCTRNIFLKFYTENPKELDLWTIEDREAYLKDIKSTLENYLTTTKD